MIGDREIKKGLHYSFAAIDGYKKESAYLEKKESLLTLLVHFSLPVKVEIENVSSVMYELRYSLYPSYTEQFEALNNFAKSFSSSNAIREICPSMQMHLHEIIQSKYTGYVSDLFLESKLLALLLYFNEENDTNHPACATCKFLTKPLEKDKIHQAKEILSDNLHNAPTIPALSLQLGINQCYLKKGFKEVYGCTIHGFVQEQRMERAKLLLLTTDLSVAEIAETIGFSSTSNFSTAFKKFTGVFPSEVSKR